MLQDEGTALQSSASGVSLPVQRGPWLERRWTAGTLPEHALAALHVGRRRSRTAGWLLLTDAMAVLLACAVARPAGWPAALLALLLVLNGARGAYRDPVEPSFLDQLPALATRVFVTGAVAMIVGDLFGHAVPATSVLVLLAACCAGRLVGYPSVRRARSDGAGRATLIVGIGPVGRQLAAAMVDHPECGRRPVGWLDDELSTPQELSLLPLRGQVLPWLGDVRSLPELMRDRPEVDVVVTDTSADDRLLVDVLQRCDRWRGEIYVVPRLHSLQSAVEAGHVRGLPLQRLTRSAHRSVSWRMKRLLDIVVSGLGIVVIAPVMALCALGVYLEGGRGVIFRQERVGLDGRHFEMLKLRSLAPATSEESAERWSITGDPRLGPFGRFLRTMSLDELPQLWNVLKGDMSLVGPRPERPFFVDDFSRRYPHYWARHRVPVGLTGWAQVSGLRGDTDIAERASFDNAYIASWSLWSDIKILLRTAVGFVARAGR